MSRTRSEIAFGAALRDVDDSVPTFVYKPPDVPGPSQGKPCDFMVWTLAGASAEPRPDRADLGVSLDDIDARLASGYAGLKHPLMVAVADVSALRAEVDMRDPYPSGPAVNLVDVAWFECKELGTAVAEAFPCKLVRPPQRQGIRQAMRIGIPYWLAVYWKRHRAWTISDAVRLEATGDLDRTSLQRSLLNSRFGIDADPSQLSSVLKSLLAGEVEV